MSREGPRVVGGLRERCQDAHGRGVRPTPDPHSSSESKTQPTLPVAKIDERLGQYTQAVEVGPWTEPPLPCCHWDS